MEATDPITLSACSLFPWPLRFPLSSPTHSSPIHSPPATSICDLNPLPNQMLTD